MRHYRNQPSGTVGRARDLRRHSTKAEQALWRALRESFPDQRWRRQMPVGPYFVDLACFAEKLIVEADGGQHAEQVACDEQRERFLNGEGYRVLRFWNNDILDNLDGVINTIANALSPRERKGGAQRRKGEGDDLANGSPSPYQPSAGPLPLPVGEV